MLITSYSKLSLARQLSLGNICQGEKGKQQLDLKKEDGGKRWQHSKETEWKHFTNLSCQTKSRKLVMRNENQAMQASPRILAFE